MKDLDVKAWMAEEIERLERASNFVQSEKFRAALALINALEEQPRAAL